MKCPFFSTFTALKVLKEVTDASGEVYYFRYSNGTTSRVDPPAPVVKTVTAKVNISSSTSGFFFRTTTYTTTITTTATNTTIKTVQYSTNNGSSWKTGSSFTSSSKPTSFLIRVIDVDGDVYNFVYNNGTLTAK